MSSHHLITAAAAAALTAGALLGAGTALADTDTDRIGRVTYEAQGDIHDSVEDAWTAGSQKAWPARQGADPVVRIGANGTVREADMSHHKIESRFAAPQTQHAAGALQPCKRGETSGGPFNVGSERCQDLGR